MAMDTTSVSIVAGLRKNDSSIKQALRLSTFFALFQAGMPLIGYFIGSLISDFVDSYSGIFAFVLLSAVGIKMLFEAAKSNADDIPKHISTKELIAISIATSIDALIIGVTLPLIEVPLFVSIFIIGVFTFVLSILGYLFGNRLGELFGRKIEFLGGIALIVLGTTFLFL